MGARLQRLRARWWIIRHPFKVAAIRQFVAEHPEKAAALFARDVRTEQP